jgi:hypothetical protein
METEVNWKVWLGGSLALAIAASLCLIAPRLGGLALIVLALGAVAGFAYRLL